MKNIIKEKGITLIALVITIIVLLILAGVAISMLSGENGILTRASEAKEKTEEAQNEEETGLASMDLETYFIINNLKYKCGNGYVTGIDNGEKVKQLDEELKKAGYTISTRYDRDDGEDKKIEEQEKENLIISTGMGIEKEGKIIARTIVFGDFNCKDGVTSTDVDEINVYLENSSSEPLIIQSIDVDHNGIINEEDFKMVDKSLIQETKINQYVYVNNKENYIVYNKQYKIKKYIENELPEAFKNQDKYKFEYNEGKYVLTGATIGTDSSEITSLIPNSTIKKLKKVVDKIEAGCKIIIEINNGELTEESFDIQI